MVEQPITNLCVVSDKKNCPPRYTILDRTIDNDDGDFWKDKFFQSKSFRYLCYTKEQDPIQVNQVVTDLALIGSKDPTPDGYTAISTTSDTREQALRKHILCARFVAKSMTNAAVMDICLFKDSSFKERMYTLVGEVNGINLTFKMAAFIIPIARPAPPVPSSPKAIVAATAAVTNQGHTPSYASLQRQSGKPMTGIEGVPFKLNEVYTSKLTSSRSSPNGQPFQFTIRSLAEVTRLTTYDFSQERTVVGS